MMMIKSKYHSPPQYAQQLTFFIAFFWHSINQLKSPSNKQNYNSPQPTMKSLQSEKNPLRISPNFYQPYHPKRQNPTKRIYPSSHKNSSPLLDVAEPASVLSYVGQLEKVKPLHRQFYHLEMYYPEKERNMKKVDGMYSTVSRSRKKSVSSFLKPIHHRTIQQQRDTFMKTFRQRENKKQEQNQSFYNTTAKSKFIMDKFYDDLHINERSSPTYQNMLNRTLIIDDILGRVNRNQRKFVHGF